MHPHFSLCPIEPLSCLLWAGNGLWPSEDEGGRPRVKSRGALRARERSGGTSPGRGEGYQLLVLPSMETDTTCASGPGLGGRAWLLEPPPTCQGSTRQKPRSGSYMLISGGTWFWGQNNRKFSFLQEHSSISTIHQFFLGPPSHGQHFSGMSW